MCVAIVVWLSCCLLSKFREKVGNKIWKNPENDPFAVELV
jgi:hypothetical protein